jgi:CRP-like cAMP-binding protein
VNIFKHWKHNQISSVLMSAEEVKLTRNQVIFKEGDVPKLLYFIKQGEVEVNRYFL